MEKDWRPIESNPNVFNEYSERLGFPVSEMRWYEVISLDPDMWLSFIPTPVYAVVLVFPIKGVHNELREKQLAETEEAKGPCFIK